MVDFGRLITAMVTPFNEKLELDFDKVTALVDHLADSGTESVVVAGTTGESPTLDKEEKVRLFKHVVDAAAGRMKVIAGTGGNNTAASIELTRAAEAAGVDGIMLVVPYYNKPSQEGLYQHFSAIAAATKLPIMLYNIPGRSAINMTVDTVIRLSKIENIVAIKEASGDLGQMTEIIRNTDDDFYLYSGDDKLTLPIMAIGGYGVVSVAAHVVGKEMKQMIDSFVDGNVAEAAEIHQKLYPIFEGLFLAPNPAPVKAALQLSGVDVGSVRLPLVPLNEKEMERLKDIMRK